MSDKIETYPGSGTRWARHLNKHNVEPIHLWNSDWYHDTSITRFALKFSRINKIVSNNNWANLKEENGLDGGWDHLNSSGLNNYGKDWSIISKKISESLKGVPRPAISETNKKAYTEGRRSVSGAFTREGALEMSKRAWTPEVAAKRKETRNKRKFQQGRNNSQFGTSWIWHELFGNKKVKRDMIPNYIDQGWVKTYKPGYKISLTE